MMKEKNPILSNKFYLYLTEFFAGMSVMAVELGASRLLAPYFSSSQIVWTIIIGTIMIAMALGNIYGGRSADKDPDPDRLYRRILIASIWIALIPVVGKYIIVGISAVLILSVNINFLIVAAFAACMIIFVFPLFLLGTVTPSLVKYTVDSLNDSGKTVGMLNASNTIGSIIGTFVPTFISIPAFGTSITFLIFAGILLLLSIVYFVTGRKRSKLAAASVVIFLLSCILGNNSHFAFWINDLTVEDESIYNYLQVREDETNVILSTNVLFGVQSIYKKGGEFTGMYYDYAMAAPYMSGLHTKDRPLEVLILGMGTGTFATQCSGHLGEMHIEGVEIDEKITALATEYFGLSEDTVVTTYDGRAYLDALPKDRKFDVILVDAYQDITIPFQMASVEFFTSVKDHLSEDGVMVVNLNMRDNEEGNMNEYLSDTISSVFPEVYFADVERNTNRELFAGNTDILASFTENVSLEEDASLTALMDRVGSRLVRYEADDHVMTDDKAPVELLSMRAIDGLIQGEASYYREIFREEGLSGLMESLSF
ncbi:MAG: fused MFS/spermidine synthase [Lachnospiraceae bacterium]|nr:fused MFS/spermidine synthase [Lachnospiraceae bacterium]